MSQHTDIEPLLGKKQPQAKIPVAVLFSYFRWSFSRRSSYAQCKLNQRITLTDFRPRLSSYATEAAIM